MCLCSTFSTLATVILRVACWNVLGVLLVVCLVIRDDGDETCYVAIATNIVKLFWISSVGIVSTDSLPVFL